MNSKTSVYVVILDEDGIYRAYDKSYTKREYVYRGTSIKEVVRKAMELNKSKREQTDFN